MDYLCLSMKSVLWRYLIKQAPMAAFLHSQATLLGWDFAQLCPQGKERERLCIAKTFKGQQGSQEEARNRVGWEMVHKALGGWSSAGLSSFCKS